jgi:hypothetical protein
MSRTIDAIRTSLMAGAAAIIVAGAAQAQLDTALNVARQSTQAGAQAQEQIDDLADQADSAEREFIALQDQIQSQRVFVQQQQVFLRSQEVELASLNRQLERVETIERDLTPMLLEMYVELERFIQADLPFQMEDRMERLADIEEALGDPLIPPAEKYRLLLNAYEIESSYGRSLRAYTQEVDVDGAAEQAELLQIGRVALIRRVAGNLEMVTKDNREWRPVPGSMANDVQRAFRIANELTTPDVFPAPLPGPTPAQ